MAKTPARNRDRTCQRILDAAADLLAEEGFTAWSVNGLAGRAGVGKPLLYRYFGDFPGVLDALVMREAKRWRAEGAAETLPANLPIPAGAYRKIRFARRLAGDPAMKALYRALLAGELSRQNAARLLDLAPVGEGEERASAAFMLAGIVFIVLVKDQSETFAGLDLTDVRELARLEGISLKLTASPGT